MTEHATSSSLLHKVSDEDLLDLANVDNQWIRGHYIAEMASELICLRPYALLLAGKDECYYDHDDYCQTHYFNKPCPHETVRKEWGK